MYLSITASPGVRGISITARDRILAVHLYGGVVFSAAVARGSVCPISDEDLKKTAWLLSKLMDKVGELAKSRYYTFTGPLEFLEDVVKFRPYINPTATVEIELRGRVAVAYIGDVKKKFRTRVDISNVLKKYVEFLKKCYV